MLKRWDSLYEAGRPKGPWFKWKRDPHLVDAVLMYAQRGHGKRSSFYSDYTFGVWTEDAEGQLSLTPVGKAYFGFTDEELKQIDKFVRDHTVERFGPVRSVRADRDFGLRCRAAGLEGVFDPTLRAHHLYARTFAQYLRDADASARGNWTLHQSHPELGALGRRQLTQHLPGIAGVAVVIGAGRLHRPVVWALSRATDIAGFVRWWKLESVAAMTTAHAVELHVIRQLDRGV